jgi:hypothetical protein
MKLVDNVDHGGASSDRLYGGKERANCWARRSSSTTRRRRARSPRSDGGAPRSPCWSTAVRREMSMPSRLWSTRSCGRPCRQTRSGSRLLPASRLPLHPRRTSLCTTSTTLDVPHTSGDLERSADC